MKYLADEFKIKRIDLMDDDQAVQRLREAAEKQNRIIHNINNRYKLPFICVDGSGNHKT